MRIIIAAGGSGGHIFPALALASELEKRGSREIFFVSSKKKLDREMLKERKDRCYFLSVNPIPLKLNISRYVGFAVKLACDVLTSLYILVKLRPAAVVGFGGYSSGAISLIAAFSRIPVIIHEQNLVPGRANKILCRLAKRVAVSFKETEEYLGCGTKISFTGNPIRLDMLSNNRAAAAGRLRVSPEKFTVLVMGGSQGAKFLNRTVSEAAKMVVSAVGDKIQFVHLAGRNDFDEITRFYRENDIPGKVIAFLEQMADAYSVSDIAVSRSGASAVFELAYYSKAMILVPYPHPKNNQRANAMYFSQKLAAVYKEEADISADEISAEILSFFRDRRKLDAFSRAAGLLSVPDAAGRLAGEVIGLASKKGH